MRAFRSRSSVGRAQADTPEVPGSSPGGISISVSRAPSTGGSDASYRCFLTISYFFNRTGAEGAGKLKEGRRTYEENSTSRFVSLSWDETCPMSKVTILAYVTPRCIICGRDLPKDRKQKCYICRPSKSKYAKPVKKSIPGERIPYTIEDCCALSWAYGISYGQVRQILDNKLPWPPRIRPLVWPEGSAHEGE